jgi:hypothetical protein
MNMEVRPDQWIDMALTAGALLAAGGFCVTVYAMFPRRRAVAAPVASPLKPAVDGTSTRAGFDLRNNVEFISFGGASRDRTAIAPPSLGQSDRGRRRNRVEIIRQARQMIERGADDRNITQSLEMTEGELALLRQDMNR